MIPPKLYYEWAKKWHVLTTVFYPVLYGFLTLRDIAQKKKVTKKVPKMHSTTGWSIFGFYIESKINLHI